MTFIPDATDVPDSPDMSDVLANAKKLDANFHQLIARRRTSLARLIALAFSVIALYVGFRMSRTYSVDNHWSRGLMFWSAIAYLLMVVPLIMLFLIILKQRMDTSHAIRSHPDCAAKKAHLFFDFYRRENIKNALVLIPFAIVMAGLGLLAWHVTR